ncbi:GL16003 [Drosophila persimilis]|uniref:GL16003 n=1 Tax=Drosophila persimilis TaxID=7234 RepID=B4H9W4_DROPE|nr:GL16003 [Drosophila persimilis]
MVPRPVDRLLQQADNKRVISHEEIKDYHETEDIRHLGDFTDQTYVKAVREGAEDLEAVLCSPESQRQLVPLGPQVVANRSKSRKTIDSEDTQKRCLAQEDGTLVTESKRTTEHELILDDELPERDERGLRFGLEQEQVTTTAANQRYFRQRDEQHVDVLANGKLLSTEMRYAAETTQMDKDGPGELERPGDWDSLSDRMRKLRRSQQQQQKEVALLADRKDALTKRPLDFDREEETRKGETMKWLESHFGSESTASNDSRDDEAEAEVEPTKKSYFNVTIKSQSQPAAHVHAHGHSQSQLTTQHPHHPPQHHAHHPQTLPRSAERERERERERDRERLPPAMAVPATTLERKPANQSGAGRSKYFQGISNWSERKEAGPLVNHFSSQAFREDLQETIRRNGLKKKISGPTSSQGSGLGTTAHAPDSLAKDSYVSREDILQQKRQSLSSQFLARSMRGSHDALDDLEAIPGPGPAPVPPRPEEPSHKRVAYGHRHNNSNPVNGIAPAAVNGRGKSYEPAAPTPPLTSLASMEFSGSSSNLGLARPTVPQRRRAIEKKLGEHSHAHVHVPVKATAPQPSLEPPPDYSPPPRSRSRSSSPQVDYLMTRPPREVPTSTMTLSRKQQQRTRFAPTSNYPPALGGGAGVSTGTLRPGATSASTSNLSAVSGSAGGGGGLSKPSRMGQVIGNSLRKLVSKIRSASAERKFRMKSASSKSREQSPSQGHGGGGGAPGGPGAGVTTYQQYNVIDGHIGGGHRHSSNDSEDSASDIQHRRERDRDRERERERERERDREREREPLKPETQSTLAISTQSGRQTFKRAESADPQLQHLEQTISPRQRYYLGEDPYSSTLYGKENIYERRPRQRYDQRVEERADRERDRDRDREDDYYESRAPPPVTSSHTLGRYQKHGQRFSGSTPNLHQQQQDYRSAQTLPRKMHEHRYSLEKPLPPHGRSTSTYVTAPPAPTSLQQQHQHHQQPHPQQRGVSQVQAMPQGPAKPARTYAKVLNRSKSFNVHGMNGSNDPSPIYIEKLTRNNYSGGVAGGGNSNYSNGYQLRQEQGPGQSQNYKSNPHLFSGKDNSLKSGLKSPSIVNLISRSQKDLTKIATGNEDDPDLPYQEDKKQMYLRGLHQQAPDLYRVIHGDEDYGPRSPSTNGHKYPLQPKYSLDSRSPPSVELNKDTASIVRRSSEVDSKHQHQHQHQQHVHTHHQHLQHPQQQQPHLRRGSGATIIELRNTAGHRK